MIVPFPPGGATDVTARILADELTAKFKQTFVIENRAGAAGAIGIDQVAKSKPDGYTLGVSGVGPTAIFPIIDPKLSYSPARDLDMIAGLSAVDLFLIARLGFPANNMKELIDYARANPGKVTYATAGVAGPAQLQTESLALFTNIKMLHVPFAGDTPAITAVLSGDVDIGMVGVASGGDFRHLGQAQGARRRRPDTHQGVARPADHHRANRLQGVHRLHLERAGGSEGHPAGCDRKAERGDQRDFGKT